MFRPALCALLSVLGALVPTAAESPGTLPPPSAARAVELYDAARYAEARQELERLPPEQLDGSLLYRLYYCQNLAHAPEAAQTLAGAIDRLAREHREGKSLASSFYLVNAYTNAGKAAEARQVAGETTSRIEGDASREPTDAVDRFRLGKLYADQQKAPEAERWYTAAVPGLEQSGSTAYLLWASRYLAEALYARDEYTDAEPYFTRLTAMDKPAVEDLQRLGICRARVGMYAEAGKAWRRAVLLDPANGDEARYAALIAEAVAQLPAVSAAAPDGRLWTQLTPPDLSQILTEQTAEVQAVREAASKWGELDEPAQIALHERLAKAHAVFLGAALEYTLQGESIREAAFSGGYAPLIFQSNEWKLWAE
jgi:tetratricopeptide (TPR) repeat protein